MSSNRILRRFAVLGLLALSSGCGFTPIYGESDALRDKLAYQTAESIAGFRMRGRLEERFGVTSAPLFVLSVTQTAISSTSAITADGDTTRFNVIGNAKWALTDATSGAEVAAGEVQTFTGYAATGSTTATQAAATDANRRLSVALADLIVSRVLIVSPELAA